MSNLHARAASTSQSEFAQQEVEGFLHRSQSFRALPPERQSEVLADTRKVVGFIAEAGGEPLLRRAIGARAMDAHNASRHAPARALQDGSRPDDDKTDSQYVGDAGRQFAEVVDTVDFPGFVAELIQGVFQAVVDASIQQMEAFAELVANVAKSVDQFMQDNVSEDQARDYLVSQYPDHLEADLEAGRIRPKADADPDSVPNFLQDLGLPFDLDDITDEETERELVSAGRKRVAMDRQQMLATMVLMGLNRIVVTDGRIRASVVFNLNTSAMETESEIRSRSFEYGRTSDKHASRYTKSSGFLGMGKKTTTVNKLDVKTDISTTSTRDNEEERVRETELKAKLTGNVDLRFKSETFPLEKMTELMGTNTELIASNARAESPTTTPGAAARPLPTPPPLPTA